MSDVFGGIITITAGLWNFSRANSWLLVLNGAVGSALGATFAFYTDPLAFRTVVLLIVVMAMSIGIYEFAVVHTLRDVVSEWLFGAAGVASIAFAIGFLGIAFRWTDCDPTRRRRVCIGWVRRARPCLALTLVFLCSTAEWLAAATADVVRFNGEVSRGAQFYKPIGHELTFVLDGSSDGWSIRIAPEKVRCNDDFAWVVNMPIRNYNDLRVNTTYGFTAQQAVERSPREFNFVLSCAGYKRESTFLALLTESVPVGTEPPSDKEVAYARSKLGTSPQGHGKFWIDKFRISAAPESVEGTNYGQIDWLRFHVEIQFPEKADALTVPNDYEALTRARSVR